MSVKVNNDPHATSRLSQVKLIDLERHRGDQGSLSVVQNDGSFPLEVKRVFYVHDVPAGSGRGGHSHFRTCEIIVAVTGALEVELSDGTETRRWRLDRPFQGLYVPHGLWIVIDGFAGGTTYLVMTSTEYEAADYVHDYDKFLELTAAKR